MSRVCREVAIRQRGPHQRRIVASLRNTSAVSSGSPSLIAVAEENVFRQRGDRRRLLLGHRGQPLQSDRANWSRPPRRPAGRHSCKPPGRANERRDRPARRSRLAPAWPAAVWLGRHADLGQQQVLQHVRARPSNSTATSVPVRKYGSEPVRATLVTTFGPSSRPRPVIERHNCR